MYLLGLDSGGTKTDVTLCRLDGSIVKRSITGAGSMTGLDSERSFANLRQAILNATEGISQSEILAFFAGISGGGLPLNRVRFKALFDEILPDVRIRDNGSDAVNAISSGIGQKDGLLAISGTGSSVFARTSGQMRQVGGWGYLVSDEGSGYDLGRRAMRIALMDYDGRGEKTVLRSMLEQSTGYNMVDLVVHIYSGDSKQMLAGFAPMLLEAAEAGDSAANIQLRESVADLTHAIRTAAKICGSKLVVTAGSVWKNAAYRNCVSADLGEEYRMILPELPPVYGSVVQAAYLANLPTDDAHMQNFKKTLEKI